MHWTTLAVLEFGLFIAKEELTEQGVEKFHKICEDKVQVTNIVDRASIKRAKDYYSKIR